MQTTSYVWGCFTVPVLKNMIVPKKHTGKRGETDVISIVIKYVSLGFVYDIFQLNGPLCCWLGDSMGTQYKDFSKSPSIVQRFQSLLQVNGCLFCAVHIHEG